jgi:hypothetical protein
MGKETTKSKFKKITLNLPLPLYADIKARAAFDTLNITAEIITLCRQGLEQSKAVELMPLIVEQYLNEQKHTKNQKKA